jgi:hypothetical protein
MKGWIMKQELLEAIADTLNGNGRNYSVFLQVYEVPMVPTVPPAGAAVIVADALQTKVTLIGLEEVLPGAVWPAIEEMLRYKGSYDAGPAAASLDSRALSELLDTFGDEVTRLASAATRIESFWFSEGSPAYDVFWEFAYLFREHHKATLLIGASSD